MINYRYFFCLRNLIINFIDVPVSCTLEESYFKTQYLQKYENGVNTRFLYKIPCRICSWCLFFSKLFSFPSKMSLISAIWIKTQNLQSNLHQNTITLGVVWTIVQYFFFFLNKPILQLERMNSSMSLLLYSIKRRGNIYCSVAQCYQLQFPCFGIQSTEFCYQALISCSQYCVLMHHRRIYRLQMWTRMQHSIFKISNDEEM